MDVGLPMGTARSSTARRAGADVRPPRRHTKQLYSKKYGVHLARFTHKSSTLIHASTKEDGPSLALTRPVQLPIPRVPLQTRSGISACTTTTISGISRATRNGAEPKSAHCLRPAHAAPCHSVTLSTESCRSRCLPRTTHFCPVPPMIPFGYGTSALPMPRSGRFALTIAAPSQLTHP